MRLAAGLRFLATAILLGLAGFPATVLAGLPTGGLLGQDQGPSAGYGDLGSGRGLPQATDQGWLGVPAGRIFWWQGRRWIRVRMGDRFEDLSREAYGHPDNWYLIYMQNRAVFASPPPAGGEVILWLPPSPQERTTRTGDRTLITVIPGDTLSGIAADLWGEPRLWSFLHQANLSQFPDPADPTRLFRDPPEVPSKVFLVPQPSFSTPGGAHPGSVGPGNRPGSPVAAVPGAPGPGGAGALSGLDLRGPEQIGEREASIILEAAGFFDDRIMHKHSPPARTRLEAALMALTWGTSYSRPRGVVPLDHKRKQALFEQYGLMKQALARYGAWPNISAKDTPQAYEGWVRAAAGNLTEVSASEREELMRSLMATESGRTHWKNSKPIVSYAGAVGFGQFLPATAKGLGINPYDPAENLAGIAIYLNRLIKEAKSKGHSGRAAVRHALAAYNGGSNFPPSSIAYAEGILGRLRGGGTMVA